MGRLRLLVTVAGAAVVCVVALLASAAARAAADEPCSGAAMYVAAHEDDTLLFQSPALLQDIRSNHCARTVFVTAGDAGLGQQYWQSREEGVEAAYAQMAGVADQWSGSQITVEGHSIHLATLTADPGVSILYLRLPDGGVDGQGFPAYGEQSLMKLWNGGNGDIPAIAGIEAVDDSATYTYQGLAKTMTALIEEFGARQIATQNYTQALIGPDHPDHVATAYFVKAAQATYPAAHRMTGFEDYEVFLPPNPKAANLSGELLVAKRAAFLTYAPFDEACAKEEDCEGAPYVEWLEREYVAGTETTGVVANAGYAQTTLVSAPVGLDGSGSSDQSGAPLTYSWVQTGGPAVVLSGAKSPIPTFVTPSHPTLLTFALTVADGSDVSAPDLVRVRVPSPTPVPTAVVGPGQAVTSGAVVQLDGSGSWDPNSLPLQYAWTQTAGPKAALNGAATATPSFIAPPGPTTLTFSLAVYNGSQASAPATLSISVGEAASRGPQPPPPSVDATIKLSKKRVKLAVGRASRRLIEVVAPSGSSAACRGGLPKGARCRVTAQHDVIVEGSKSVKRVGTYHLTVRVAGPAGIFQRTLTVVFRRSGRDSQA